MSEDNARKQQEKLAKGKFDLNDFRLQIVQMKKMGPVKDLMGKVPGMSRMASGLEGVDADGEVKRIQGIIDSMTPAERANPAVIDLGRRDRIAAGAGVPASDIASLVTQFDAMAAFVKQMAALSMWDKVKMMMGRGKAGAFNPGSRLVAPKGGTGKELSPKEREELQKQREKESSARKKRNRRRESGDRDDDCASGVRR